MEIKSDRGELPRPTPSEVTTYADHAHYYATDRAHDAMAFLRGLPVRAVDDAPTTDAERSFPSMVTALRERGFDTYDVDLTTDRARRAGYRQTRVVAPGLNVANLSYEHRLLGNDRLRSLAREANGTVSFNPHPHPIG